MITSEDISLFDSYLNNTLNEQERTLFEKRLLSSKTFNTSFTKYKEDSALISSAFEYEEIKNSLKQTHKRLFKPSRKSKILRPAFLLITGAAAGIAILFTIPIFKNSTTENGASFEYQELANSDQTTSEEVFSEDNNITSNHTDTLYDTSFVDLKNNISTINKTPKGTSFLITEKGYFLTAKHLVENKNKITLQQKTLKLTFEAEVVYIDSLTDFALLKCHDSIALQLKKVPFEFLKQDAELGDEVFTLGYSKKDVVYTKGVVSSETGFRSDSLYMEVSLPSNAGNSGAPLFNMNGQLLGLITANHAQKQSVTYVLKHNHLKEYIDTATLAPPIDLSKNKTPRHQRVGGLIKRYRTYIFEVH